LLLIVVNLVVIVVVVVVVVVAKGFSHENSFARMQSFFIGSFGHLVPEHTPPRKMLKDLKKLSRTESFRTKIGYVVFA
jgi:hypothetical protein